MIKYLYLVIFLVWTVQAQAQSTFSCQCQAQGPGYEAGENIDKICSYHCGCQVTSNTSSAVSQKIFNLEKLKSTAYSFEEWDAGSHICHGQYAFRPNLDSPNWRIQVRFSKFRIDQSGVLTYEESAEIANGFYSAIRRSEAAPEILEALIRKLE